MTRGGDVRTSRKTWHIIEVIPYSKCKAHDDKCGPITTCWRPISMEVTEKSYIAINDCYDHPPASSNVQRVSLAESAMELMNVLRYLKRRFFFSRRTNDAADSV